MSRLSATPISSPAACRRLPTACAGSATKRSSSPVRITICTPACPAEIQRLFEQALRDRCPKNVKIEFANHGLAEPVLTPIDSDAVTKAREALQLGFGVAPTLMREGGSIPVVALIKRVLGIDTLLI